MDGFHDPRACLETGCGPGARPVPGHWSPYRGWVPPHCVPFYRHYGGYGGGYGGYGSYWGGYSPGYWAGYTGDYAYAPGYQGFTSGTLTNAISECKGVAGGPLVGPEAVKTGAGGSRTRAPGLAAPARQGTIRHNYGAWGYAIGG